jgi:uncharacterized membrane protein
MDFFFNKDYSTDLSLNPDQDNILSIIDNVRNTIKSLSEKNPHFHLRSKFKQTLRDVYEFYVSLNVRPIQQSAPRSFIVILKKQVIVIVIVIIVFERVAVVDDVFYRVQYVYISVLPLSSEMTPCKIRRCRINFKMVVQYPAHILPPLI